jgi:hypothetical protein
MKERRSYRRFYFTENVKFGCDKPIYNGMSVDLSPDGMSVISDRTLDLGSNIIINIDTEIEGVVTVEGQVIWVSSIPDLPSRMGIKFNKHNERLIRVIRIYLGKIQDQKNHLNLN